MPPTKADDSKEPNWELLQWRVQKLEESDKDIVESVEDIARNAETFQDAVREDMNAMNKTIAERRGSERVITWLVSALTAAVAAWAARHLP